MTPHPMRPLPPPVPSNEILSGLRRTKLACNVPSQTCMMHNDYSEIDKKGLAERVGFEPTLEFPLNTLSKRAPSATRPSLRSRLWFQEELVEALGAGRMRRAQPRWIRNRKRLTP